MTLHPKDQAWADPALNDPKNKILANYSEGMPYQSSAPTILKYRKVKSIIYRAGDGTQRPMKREDFEEDLPDLELYKQTDEADYYRYK